MFFTLRNNELEQIARIYEVEQLALAGRLDLDDEIISFEPHEGGVRIQTKSGRNLTLFFKDGLKL